MSLERVVVVPFRSRGRERLPEGEFVVALSLDREWFSPDQAKRVVDVALGRGLLREDDDALALDFDASDVAVPDDFFPDESVLREQSVFERALDAIVAAGVEKQEAVAGINRRQQELAVTIEAAAVLYARERDIDVGDVAERAREDALGGGD